MNHGKANGLTDPPAQRADWPFRVVLAARRSLDLGGLSRLIRESDMLTLAAAEIELDKAAEACANLTPDLAMFDAAFPDGAAFDVAEELLARRKVRAAAFLDDEFAMARAQRAISIPHAAYFTRHDEFTHICGGVGELLARSTANVTVPQVESHCPAPKFLLDANRLRELNCDGFLGLSAKERQIMRLLAPATPCRKPRMLRVARSTVDNHKSRIMKKLNICHMTQITRIAMRVGLID